MKNTARRKLVNSIIGNHELSFMQPSAITMIPDHNSTMMINNMAKNSPHTSMSNRTKIGAYNFSS